MVVKEREKERKKIVNGNLKIVRIKWIIQVVVSIGEVRYDSRMKLTLKKECQSKGTMITKYKIQVD